MLCVTPLKTHLVGFIWSAFHVIGGTPMYWHIVYRIGLANAACNTHAALEIARRTNNQCSVGPIQLCVCVGGGEVGGWGKRRVCVWV